jgi:hypothetical protein
MSLLDTASLVVTPNGTKAGKLYSVVPSSGAGDLDVTRATTATRVNSSGLIESVASNVPRLDYTNGSCPSVLVEPQRTNLFTYSEQFNNILWLTSGTTVTSNAYVSPDGTTTAERIVGDNTWYIAQTQSLTLGSVYTISFYVKSNTGSNQTFRLFGSDGSAITANLTANSTWQKFSYTFTAGIGISHGLSRDSSNTPVDLQIWGAQLEAGSYATSYIPTTSASVTRNADVISKTGISSLIGQTEGVVFFDADVTNTTGLQIGTTDGGSDYLNSIQIAFGASSTNVNIFNGGGVQFSNASAVSTGRKKIAIAYKANDFALYINGVQIATDSSGSVPTLSGIFFNHQNLGTTNGRVNLTALWKTRLTNTQLAQLTTI